jgi:hypothetical protein
MSKPRLSGAQAAAESSAAAASCRPKVLATFDTQEEAILWARTRGYPPHNTRVRHLNDRKKPDQWGRVCVPTRV